VLDNRTLLINWKHFESHPEYFGSCFGFGHKLRSFFQS